MIIGYIKGQSLELKSELIVADTIDYLTAKFAFRTADWQGLTKWAHFRKGNTVYDIPLTDDCIQKSDHLNLAEGEWEVYLHGNAFEGGEVVERITTEIAKLTVEGTGSLNGEPFPEIPASEAEQIEAQLADHEERIDALEQGGGGGGIPDAPADGKQYARKDGAWSEVQGGDGQGWTDEQIDLLEAVFEKLVYTDAEGGQLAAQLIRSLRGGVVPEEPITITFDGAKAVISGLGNTAITYSGTTAKIGYMPL